MDPQHKRTLIATLACIIVLIGWMKLQEYWYPPAVPTTASAPADATVGQPTSGEASFVATSVPAAPSERKAGPGEFSVAKVEAGPPVTLGDDRAELENPFELSLTVTPRGAAVESVRLARYRNHVPKDKQHPDQDPYDLLQTVEDGKGTRFSSFATEKVLLVDEKQTIDLTDASWSIEKTLGDRTETATLRTTILKASRPFLSLTKTYRITKGAVHIEGSLEISNLSGQPCRVIVTERGPIGLKNEDPQRESRRFASALVAVEKDEKGAAKLDATGQPITTVQPGDYGMRADLKKLGAEKELRGSKPDEPRLLWSAVGNKYFGCIQTWLPSDSSSLPYADYLAKVVARFLDEPDITDDLTRPNDLTTEQSLGPPAPLPAGKSFTMRFESFCGAKSDTTYNKLGPEIRRRRYDVFTTIDRKGGCTFDPITDLLVWLLRNLYRVVGNYGVAIILMVIIVRLILHPLTKRSQVSMMRMQKGMQALKPKLDSIQEQYKNDRQKLNEETMKLYREEGINPASSMLGCLPMFLQMPIWVGLWTSLNTNVDLRQQPFFLWIGDLSIPDSLISFGGPVNVPLLSLVTGPIRSLNILPIFMAATMYAQQKFMQKLTKPATPPVPKLDAEGRPIPDQMAQQQKMMNFMMIFFGAMLYNQPAGLNLYIFCSSLLGMLEQYQIKRHIKKIEDRGNLGGGIKVPREPRSPSFLERLQKRAEELRQAQGSGELRKLKKQRNQPRF